jgi:hypothetical protein
MDAKAEAKSEARALAEHSRKILEAARAARREVEEANRDVEAMIWEIRHVRLGHQRLLFSIEGFDDETRPLN